jgi:hypothetical protein
MNCAHSASSARREARFLATIRNDERAAPARD